ncbi:hypothetical protein [Burkholderia sp. SIMBA_062]|uniref:hypothetical protein n=1 Tax=Burkholderia sp. SIMBA_062 TaxID=3085803 RepID=UPI00397CA1BA
MTETISAYPMPSLMSAISRRFGNLGVSIVEGEREAIGTMLRTIASISRCCRCPMPRKSAT